MYTNEEINNASSNLRRNQMIRSNKADKIMEGVKHKVWYDGRVKYYIIKGKESIYYMNMLTSVHVVKINQRGGF